MNERETIVLLCVAILGSLLAPAVNGKAIVPDAASGTSSPDFSLVANETSMSVHHNVDTLAWINVTSLNGFAGVVTLFVSVSPSSSGTQVSMRPSSVTLHGGDSAYSTLVMRVTNQSLSGSFDIMITGVGGSPNLFRSAIIHMPLTPDFSIAPGTACAGNINPGASFSCSIDLAPIFGFNGNVSLQASSSPSGPGVSFDRQTVLVNAFVRAGFTISTTSSTPDGPYTVTITGTSGAIRHPASPIFFNVVSPPTADFGMFFSDGTPLEIEQGGGYNNTISLSSQVDFTGPVKISTTVLPQVANGPIASTRPSSVFLTASSAGGGPFSSALLVSTSNTTPPGTYNITVTGTSGSINHSIFVILTVLKPVPIPMVLVSVQTAPIYSIGDTVLVYIQTSENAQAVSSTLQVLLYKPDGTTATLSTRAVSTGTFTANYTIPINGVAGTYTIKVSAQLDNQATTIQLISFQVRGTSTVGGMVESMNPLLMTELIAIASGIGVIGLVTVTLKKSFSGRRKD